MITKIMQGRVTNVFNRFYRPIELIPAMRAYCDMIKGEQIV